MNFNNFKNFVQSLSDYETLIKTDIDGVINWIDKSFYTITGYGINELQGKKISILRSPFTNNLIFKSMRENLLQGIPWKGDFINKKKDGTFFRVETIVFPLYGNQFGAVWRHRSTLICSAERSLRIKDEQGFYVIHDAGKIFTVNSNHPWIKFSTDHDTTTLQIFIDSIIEDNIGSDVKECSDAILQGKEFVGERTIALQCPGKSEVMYFTLYSGFYANAKIFYLKDITTLKHEEIHKMHQSRLASAGEMIATIAHQWKQPLNVISASIIDTQMASMMGNNFEEDCSENLKIIDEQVKFLSNTIQTFTKFLDLNTQNTPFLLIDAVNNALKMCSQRIKKRSVEVEVIVSPTQKIQGTLEEMVHIFINLINNAIDAYEDNNKLGLLLSFRSYENKDNLIIEMQDNAGGIMQTNLSKIFNPYFSTKGSKHGTGIGLYIVERTIREHFKGEISVSNINNGALFSISVPKVI